MYRKQVRRRRAVLIGLIVLGFVLLTFTFGSGSGGVGGGLGTIFDPITNTASRALKPARDLVNWFDETMAARGERERHPDHHPHEPSQRASHTHTGERSARSACA